MQSISLLQAKLIYFVKCLFRFIILFAGVAAAAYAQPRTGIFDGSSANSAEAESAESSPFSLGTYACIGWAFEKFSHFKVGENGTVFREREGNNLVYGVFALPSVTLTKKIGDDMPLSVILPMGVMKSSNGDSNAAFGLGFSLGINTGDRADVGIAIVGLFTNAESLTDQQKESLSSGTPLGTNDNREITTQPVGSITVGVYITPHF